MKTSLGVFIFIFYLQSLVSCNDKEVLLKASQIKKENFCRYFYLGFSRYVVEGKERTGYSPEFSVINVDTISLFINRHKNRFNYLAWSVLKDTIYRHLFPDSNRMREKFCRDITSDAFNRNFIILSGTGDTASFTEKEMMRVASRFFICDAVNIKDTSIVSHICVGINGQQELQGERDYTTLQAFVFEAIFYYLHKKEGKEFVSNFRKEKVRASAYEKTKFTDFKTYLLNVRKSCYSVMEVDPVVRKALKTYYKKNRENVGLVITN